MTGILYLILGSLCGKELAEIFRINKLEQG